MLTTSDALARWLTKPGGLLGSRLSRDGIVVFPECAASARRVTRGAPVGCVARGVTRVPPDADRSRGRGMRGRSPRLRNRSRPAAETSCGRAREGIAQRGETGAAPTTATPQATLAVLGAAARTGGERARRGDVTSASATNVAPERDETRLSDDSRRRRRSGPDARARSGVSVAKRRKKRRKRSEPSRRSKPAPKGESAEPDRAGFDDDGGWRHRSLARSRTTSRGTSTSPRRRSKRRGRREAAAAAAMSSSGWRRRAGDGVGCRSRRPRGHDRRARGRDDGRSATRIRAAESWQKRETAEPASRRRRRAARQRAVRRRDAWPPS